MTEFTLVLGVDRKHLEQLAWSWQSWWAFRRSTLLLHPIVVFFDRTELEYEDLKACTWLALPNVRFVPWPPFNVEYEGDPADKWTNPQRAKMLSGFVHVPPAHVTTPYWLKLDTDVVAKESEPWIDPRWFGADPAVVSHPWSYTKPPDQILKLDAWVARHKRDLPEFQGTEPLDLRPKPGSDLVKHPRIISWCSFWSTRFSLTCSRTAERICGTGKLPVPSQDGWMFYCAKRLGLPIVTANMRQRGWDQKANTNRVKEAVAELLGDHR